MSHQYRQMESERAQQQGKELKNRSVELRIIAEHQFALFQLILRKTHHLRDRSELLVQRRLALQTQMAGYIANR